MDNEFLNLIIRLIEVRELKSILVRAQGGMSYKEINKIIDEYLKSNYNISLYDDGCSLKITRHLKLESILE